MRKSILSAAIVVLIACLFVCSSTAVAQNSMPHRIGLIDMAEIFRDYVKFKDLRAQLQDQVIESDKQSKAMLAEIQNLQLSLKKLNDNAPEKKRGQNKLVDLSASYKAYRQKQQIEFIGKESKVYKDIYLEVATAVRQYAEHYKYTLILRYNKKGVRDAKEPKRIISAMNRLVVYVKPGEDITMPILEHLNRRYDPNGTIEARLKRREKNAGLNSPTQRR